MSHTERHEPKLDSPGAHHIYGWSFFLLFDDLAEMLLVCLNRGILIFCKKTYDGMIWKRKTRYGTVVVPHDFWYKCFILLICRHFVFFVLVLFFYSCIPSTTFVIRHFEFASGHSHFSFLKLQNC